MKSESDPYSDRKPRLPRRIDLRRDRQIAPAAAGGAELAWRDQGQHRGGGSLRTDGYVVFLADMLGEGNQPKGTENPMEFLAPLFEDAAAFVADASRPPTT